MIDLFWLNIIFACYWLHTECNTPNFRTPTKHSIRI